MDLIEESKKLGAYTDYGGDEKVQNVRIQAGDQDLDADKKGLLGLLRGINIMIFLPDKEGLSGLLRLLLGGA